MGKEDFLQKLLRVMDEHAGRYAFHIGDKFHTYGELQETMSRIQRLLDSSGAGSYVGVWLGDRLETYASILALWLSGKAFVPINPRFPATRNADIIEQMELEMVLCSVDDDLQNLPKACSDMPIPREDSGSPQHPVHYGPFRPGSDAYVLFTSGSTGKPKGVRISFGNLDAFTRAFLGGPGFGLGPDDRTLQINDLTFDGAISSWLTSLLCGACVYTVPPGEIKYLAAYKLMVDHQLTYIKMPPSTLSFLRAYFSGIHLPAVRYCMFGGEALPSGLLKEFEACVPNARIHNLYGPTECTIISSVYGWNDPERGGKSSEGIVSIGGALGECILEVRGPDGSILGPGEPGELWIGGPQVSAGYWKKPELTESLFVGGYYRSGDRVVMDEQGDLMFLGRTDAQVQVQGFRVELGEIEALARKYLAGRTLIAFAMEAVSGGTEICLAVERGDLAEEEMKMEKTGLKQSLRQGLPHYMIPSRLKYVDEFPRLVSGKIDRKQVIEMMSDD